MKKIASIFILFFFSLQFSIAQGKEREKVEVLRMNYISKKLALTNAEAEKFWPLYNEYNDKIRQGRIQLRQSLHRFGDASTDQEAEEIYLMLLKVKQAEAELFRQYSEKFKAIIGLRRTVKLEIAEEEFKREVVKAIRDKSE
jgi:hypothetical protein